MIRLDYTLTARQRISAGRRSEVLNLRPAYAILPGGTVRGALAAAWLTEHNLAVGDSRFEVLFERDVLFGQAIPQTAVGATLEPMSYRRCKYPSAGCSQAWIDQAIAVIDDASAAAPVCPGCQRRLSRTGRGWAGLDEVITRLTRTELNDKEVVKNGQLFTREALSSGVVLRGQLLIDEDSPDHSWFTRPRMVRIGGQRSVLGATEWTATPTDQPLAASQTDGQPLALRLRSPAILVDRYGAPTADPVPALSRALGHGVTLRRSWARPVAIEGWHMASGLPKPHDWAVDAGSTYVIEELRDDDVSLLSAQGIGLRRTEGHGHLDLLTRAKLVEAVDEVNQPSSAKAPELPTMPQPTPVLPEDLTLVHSFRVLRPLLGAVQHVGQYHRYGFAPSRIQDEITEQLNRPWTRPLPSGVRATITAILADPGYRDQEARIRAALRTLGERE